MSLAATAELPTIEDELNRKLLETVTGIMADYDNGDMSTDAYKASLKAVNDVVRGLVDESVIEIMDKERSRVDYVNGSEVRVYHSDRSLMAVKRDFYGENVDVLQVKDGEVHQRHLSFENEPLPWDSASEAFNEICALAHAKFKRVL